MGAPDDELEAWFQKESVIGDTIPGLDPMFRTVPPRTARRIEKQMSQNAMGAPGNDVQRALEVLFDTRKVYFKPHNHPMNIEDCWVCGINRSICMDTKCPGDYRLLVEAGFYG